jgi:23S rRNA-/tRNA-specific pseudouridylate synthase
MNLELSIIYEDDVLLVCDKPGDLMVEPDRNNHPNLLQQVKKYLTETTGNKTPYVQHLHRLDRVTSGVVLFTKQKEYLKNLSEQFAQRIVKKEYIAFSKEAPINTQGILEQWHRKEKKKAVIVEEGTEFAEHIKLEYTIEPKTDCYLWHIKLHTGKYHQIRAQLASLNCPIIGDELYGSLIPYQPNSIALQANKLTIVHPIKQNEMTFKPINDLLL